MRNNIKWSLNWLREMKVKWSLRLATLKSFSSPDRPTSLSKLASPNLNCYNSLITRPKSAHSFRKLIDGSENCYTQLLMRSWRLQMFTSNGIGCSGFMLCLTFCFTGAKCSPLSCSAQHYSALTQCSISRTRSRSHPFTSVYTSIR